MIDAGQEDEVFPDEETIKKEMDEAWGTVVLTRLVTTSWSNSQLICASTPWLLFPPAGSPRLQTSPRLLLQPTPWLL